MNFLLLENPWTRTSAQKMTFNLDAGEGNGDEEGGEGGRKGVARRRERERRRRAIPNV